MSAFGQRAQGHTVNGGPAQQRPLAGRRTGTNDPLAVCHGQPTAPDGATTPWMAVAGERLVVAASCRGGGGGGGAGTQRSGDSRGGKTIPPTSLPKWRRAPQWMKSPSDRPWQARRARPPACHADRTVPYRTTTSTTQREVRGARAPTNAPLGGKGKATAGHRKVRRFYAAAAAAAACCRPRGWG